MDFTIRVAIHFQLCGCLRSIGSLLNHGCLERGGSLFFTWGSHSNWHALASYGGLLELRRTDDTGISCARGFAITHLVYFCTLARCVSLDCLKTLAHFALSDFSTMTVRYNTLGCLSRSWRTRAFLACACVQWCASLSVGFLYSSGGLSARPRWAKVSIS